MWYVVCVCVVCVCGVCMCSCVRDAHPTYMHVLRHVVPIPLSQVPGALEYGITSDDVFYLEKPPGKT